MENFIVTQKAADSRVDLLRSKNPLTNIISLAYVYNQTGKRPYWFHDIYSYLVGRPLGFYNVIIIFLAIRSYCVDKDINKSKVILSYLIGAEKIFEMDALDLGSRINLSNNIREHKQVSIESIPFKNDRNEIFAHIMDVKNIDSKEIIKQIFKYIKEQRNELRNTIVQLFDLNNIDNSKDYFIADSYWLWSIGHVASLIQCVRSEYSNGTNIKIFKDDMVSILDRRGAAPHREFSGIGNNTTKDLPIYLDGSAVRLSNNNISFVEIGENHIHRGLSSQKCPIEIALELIYGYRMKQVGEKIKSVLFHPRNSNYKSGKINCRDMSVDSQKAIYNHCYKKSYDILYVGIEKNIVRYPYKIRYSQEMNANGNVSILNYMINCSYAIGSPSGATHLATALDLPTIYIEHPWALTCMMNEYTLYLPRISDLDSQSDLKKWYIKSAMLSREMWGNDTAIIEDYVPNEKIISEHLDKFDMFSSKPNIPNRHSRHDAYVKTNAKYQDIFRLYEDLRKTSEVELIHPADLSIWI